MGALKDLTGQKFGTLTVLERAKENKGNKAAWVCQCDCGIKKIVVGTKLTNGSTKTCGSSECRKKIGAASSAIDLTGQKFGSLVVIERAGSNSQGEAMWRCLCDCGQETIVRGYALRTLHTTSCGCKKYSGQDLTGKQFGRLTVIKKTHYNNQGHAYWLCQCECGKITEVRGSHLLDGNTTSCGCLTCSKGEDKIAKILEKAKINFKKEKTFNTCRFVDTNALAKFDFYLPDYNLLIEFDGEQHFNPDSRWYTDKVPIHDNYKNQWCKENNVSLIRIPYTHYEELKLEDLLPKSQFLINKAI